MAVSDLMPKPYGLQAITPLNSIELLKLMLLRHLRVHVIILLLCKLELYCRNEEMSIKHVLKSLEIGTFPLQFCAHQFQQTCCIGISWVVSYIYILRRSVEILPRQRCL